MSRVFSMNVARKVAAVGFLLAGPPNIGAALAEGRVFLEFEDGVDFQGQVRHATVDQHGVAWIATHRQLFRVEHGRPVLVDSRSSRDRRLAIAPGGERYAWLDSRKAGFGKFAVELFDLNRPGTLIAEIGVTQPPSGYGSLHLGHKAGLLVGGTPLDDPEGLKGRFRYDFWNYQGTQLASVELPGQQAIYLDQRGESVLLLGEFGAIALPSNQGKGEPNQGKEEPLWSVEGRFRNAAVANGAEVALLNPANSIHEVYVVRSGRVAKKLRLAAPVYGLDITPDGSRGVVASGAGTLSIVELDFRGSGEPKMRQLPPLPILSAHYVTAARFVNSETLAVGVIQAYGPRPLAKFYAGSVLVLKVSGQPILQRAIQLPEQATWSPQLDVAFNNPIFTAYTPKSVIFARVDN